MMINSVLYILVSKFFATIYVNIFWRRFIKTEFAGLDPLHITGHDIQLQEEIGRNGVRQLLKEEKENLVSVKKQTDHQQLPEGFAKSIRCV